MANNTIRCGKQHDTTAPGESILPVLSNFKYFGCFHLVFSSLKPLPPPLSFFSPLSLPLLAIFSTFGVSTSVHYVYAYDVQYHAQHTSCSRSSPGTEDVLWRFSGALLLPAAAVDVRQCWPQWNFGEEPCVQLATPGVVASAGREDEKNGRLWRDAAAVR